MKRIVAMIAASLTIGIASLSAQTQPYPNEAKALYNRVKGFLLAAADKMPEENYGFKASPDVRPFGQLIAHVADTQWMICSTVNDRTEGQSVSAGLFKTYRALLEHQPRQRDVRNHFGIHAPEGACSSIERKTLRSLTGENAIYLEVSLAMRC